MVKKYLFLFVLIIIYVILKSNVTEKTVPVFSFDDDKRSVKTITLRFENGINSMDLTKKFKRYKKDYLINSIKLDNTEFSLECDDINNCINEIFSLESNSFSQKYLMNGFKVNEVTFISYDKTGNEMITNDDLIYVNN